MINTDVLLTDEKKEKIYSELIPQIKNIISSSEPVITGLANTTAALKYALPYVSWAGFYFYFEHKLYLGPFQGKPACTEIEPGKGVCGDSFKSAETILVNDVNKYTGHIACDPDSKSEIVVPLKISKKSAVGVLDLDSYHYSAFSSVDKKFLEILCNELVKKLDLNNFNIT